MKLKLVTLTVFFGFSLCAVNAQINITERIKKENVVRGIIIQDGKQKEGYIKKILETRVLEGKTYKALDNFQSSIYFIPKNEFETVEKLKNKMYAKYEPKSIDGYLYIYENGDTLIYESLKYSDKSALGLQMLPKKIFLRLESKGKLSFYSYFNSLPPVMAGADFIRECYETAETPEMVIRRTGDTSSPNKIELINIEKELADCPIVVEKYKNGEYGIIGKKGSDSKFMKVINKLAVNDEMKYQALMEYNSGICDDQDIPALPAEE